MIITDKAIKLIQNNTQAKNRLAFELACSIHTVERWIRDNQDNGDLTKTAAVEIIMEETGLSFQQVLERRTVVLANETQM
jgi:hypothetical protein